MREWYTYGQEIRSYTGAGETIEVPDIINKKIVNMIGQFAFSPEKKGLSQETKENRLKIQAVTIKDGISCVGSHAFEGCTGLENIIFPKTSTVLCQRAFAGIGVKKIIIPKSLDFKEKNVCQEVFANCNQLEEVSISYGIKQLGDGMFLGCERLSNVKLPNTLKEISVDIFSKCMSLKRITIPDSVKEIGDRAFSESGLENIEIPGEVQTLGKYAFSGCKHLKKVVIRGEKLLGISRGAFAGCEELEEINIPDSVEWIAQDVFSNCKALKRVEIPERIESVFCSQFMGADKLKELVIKGKKTCFSYIANIRPIDFENQCSAIFKNVKFIAPKGSRTEAFAKKRGFVFEEMRIEATEEEKIKTAENNAKIADKAKQTLIKWMSEQNASRSNKTLWDNYEDATCDDELISAFISGLKLEEARTSWNVDAFYLTEMMKRAKPSKTREEAYGYIRDIIMHGDRDLERLQIIAKNAKEQILYGITSLSIGNLSYHKLFINLAEHYTKQSW